jgi:copper(I)-binding protein
MTNDAAVQCLILNRLDAMNHARSLLSTDHARIAAPALTTWRSLARSLASRATCGVAVVALAFASAPAFAHDYQAGDVRIVHPFATPTPPGSRMGAAYFAELQNTGTQPDRLLRASTPAAARVEIHSGDIGADGVMRMREKESLDLAPKAVVKLRPGAGDHLMLIELKKPLAAGESFPMTLEFEHGGTVEVTVVVQVPKKGGGGHGAHGGADGHGAGERMQRMH